MEVSDYLSLFYTFDVGNKGRLGKIGSGQQKICIGWKDLGGWSAGLQAAVGVPSSGHGGLDQNQAEPLQPQSVGRGPPTQATDPTPQRAGPTTIAEQNDRNSCCKVTVPLCMMTLGQKLNYCRKKYLGGK